MGHDSDSPLALGEVGREGVAIDSARRHGDAVLDGIDLGRGLGVDDDQRAGGRSCSRIYAVAAEKQGVSPDKLNGTLQNDILKEYIAQKEWCFPPRPRRCACSGT